MRHALITIFALCFSALASLASAESAHFSSTSPKPIAQGTQVAGFSFPNSSDRRTAAPSSQPAASSTSSEPAPRRTGRDRGASMGSRSGNVVARVSLGSQTMTVYVNGSKRYSWRISSGRSGYATPRGSYRPQRIYSEYYSKKYDNAPMPYAVFFSGGYAVHGTGAVGRLGSPASHGCIRLAPSNARAFFNLARTYGRNIQIVIS